MKSVRRIQATLLAFILLIATIVPNTLGAATEGAPPDGIVAENAVISVEDGRLKVTGTAEEWESNAVVTIPLEGAFPLGALGNSLSMETDIAANRNGWASYAEIFVKAGGERYKFQDNPAGSMTGDGAYSAPLSTAYKYWYDGNKPENALTNLALLEAEALVIIIPAVGTTTSYFDSLMVKGHRVTELCSFDDLTKADGEDGLYTAADGTQVQLIAPAALTSGNTYNQTQGVGWTLHNWNEAYPGGGVELTGPFSGGELLLYVSTTASSRLDYWLKTEGSGWDHWDGALNANRRVNIDGTGMVSLPLNGSASWTGVQLKGIGFGVNADITIDSLFVVGSAEESYSLYDFSSEPPQEPTGGCTTTIADGKLHIVGDGTQADGVVTLALDGTFPLGSLDSTLHIESDLSGAVVSVVSGGTEYRLGSGSGNMALPFAGAEPALSETALMQVSELKITIPDIGTGTYHIESVSSEGPSVTPLFDFENLTEETMAGKTVYIAPDGGYALLAAGAGLTDEGTFSGTGASWTAKNWAYNGDVEIQPVGGYAGKKILVYANCPEGTDSEFRLTAIAHADSWNAYINTYTKGQKLLEFDLSGFSDLHYQGGFQLIAQNLGADALVTIDNMYLVGRDSQTTVVFDFEEPEEPSPKNSYRVTYVTGFDSVTPGTELVEADAAAAYPLADAPSKVPVDHFFGGWKVGDAVYAAGDTIALTGDTIAIAVWQALSYDPVERVSLNQTQAQIKIGKRVRLTATVLPDTARQDVIWSSSNEAVATVNAQGVVSAHAAGEAVITVTTSDGAKTATCTVTVPELDPNAESELLFEGNFNRGSWLNQTGNPPEPVTLTRIMLDDGDENYLRFNGSYVEYSYSEDMTDRYWELAQSNYWQIFGCLEAEDSPSYRKLNVVPYMDTATLRFYVLSERAGMKLSVGLADSAWIQSWITITTTKAGEWEEFVIPIKTFYEANPGINYNEIMEFVFGTLPDIREESLRAGEKVCLAGSIQIWTKEPQEPKPVDKTRTFTDATQPVFVLKDFNEAIPFNTQMKVIKASEETLREIRELTGMPYDMVAYSIYLTSNGEKITSVYDNVELWYEPDESLAGQTIRAILLTPDKQAVEIPYTMEDDKLCLSLSNFYTIVFMGDRISGPVDPEQPAGDPEQPGNSPETGGPSMAGYAAAAFVAVSSVSVMFAVKRKKGISRQKPY